MPIEDRKLCFGRMRRIFNWLDAASVLQLSKIDFDRCRIWVIRSCSFFSGMAGNPDRFSRPIPQLRSLDLSLLYSGGESVISSSSRGLEDSKLISRRKCRQRLGVHGFPFFCACQFALQLSTSSSSESIPSSETPLTAFTAPGIWSLHAACHNTEKALTLPRAVARIKPSTTIGQLQSIWTYSDFVIPESAMKSLLFGFSDGGGTTGTETFVAEVLR